MFISQKIIFINRTIIQVAPEKNDKSFLNIKVYEKESEHPTNYTFSNNANGQVISMGCGDEANIHIKTDGNLIALIHARLKYDKQRDIWRGKAEKYFKTLDEIKEYCTDMKKDHYWGMRIMRFANKILQKISECEV